MTRATERALAGEGVLGLLRRELEPRPGRLAAVARIAFCCTVVVAIGMTFQIPLVPYMAYLVFLLSHDEAASTLLTAAVGMLAATVAIALSLLLYTFDAAAPAVRLPLMALGALLGLFLSRTLTLGPLAFLSSYVLVMSQTFLDQVPNLEVLTRLVLWLWIVAAVPAAVTVLANLLLGERPAALARRKAEALLRALAEALRRGAQVAGRPEEDACALVELRERVGVVDRQPSADEPTDRMLIETLAQLLLVHRRLPAGVPPAAVAPLADGLTACADAFAAGRAPSGGQLLPDNALLEELSPEARPVLVALAEGTSSLRAGLARRGAAATRAGGHASPSPFVADAFTNPEHVRYAVKTTAAVMASYVVYSALDWPEISTAITTCFFVALGSFGETMHKLSLRILGALVGGIAAALCIVFVLPHVTTIGGLSLIVAAGAAVCAWVSTSSERIAYAGMQVALAFFLGVLQGYGPGTGLDVLRDRVIGILLGNVLIAVAFTVLWPTSAAEQARQALARALRALGHLLAARDRAEVGPRLDAIRALVQARNLIDLAGFELGLVGAPRLGPGAADSLDRLAGAILVVVNQPGDAWPLDAELAGRLDEVATRLAGTGAVTRIPRLDALGTHADGPSHAGPLQRAAQEARALLQSQMEHALVVRG